MSTFHAPPELDLLFGSGPTRLAIEYNPSSEEPNMVGQVKGTGPSCQASYQNNVPDLITTKFKGRKRHKAVKKLQEKKCAHGSSDPVSFSADILYNINSSSNVSGSSGDDTDSKKLKFEEDSLWVEAFTGIGANKNEEDRVVIVPTLHSSQVVSEVSGLVNITTTSSSSKDPEERLQL